jgi:hypothetical protein
MSKPETTSAPALDMPVEHTNSIDEDHTDDENVDDSDLKAPLEWDEGGQSHCGYGDTMHSILMSVGKAIHKVVGEPSEWTQKHMREIGNWFQEASCKCQSVSLAVW